jgi:hypothetical protein
MFTWECPKCGREIDIAESECPHCSQQGKAASTVVATEQPPAPKVAAPQSLPTPSRGAAAGPRPRQAPPAGSWGLQGKHIAIFAVLAVVAIAAAIFFARPDLFRSAPPFEEVPLAEGAGESGSAYLGDIEVAGVRTWYDAEYNPKVNAVVINHSESAQAGVNLLVEMRTREASTADTPLASFEIQLKEPLGPREARDVQFDLKAMGTLASLPPWHEMRVDLQRP